MIINSKYMARCIQLAEKARGYASPNPMVGAVVVYNDIIIGEGYHKCYGQAHAEVNAIESVKDKSLLSKSTVYVSLEPCAHFGKTPPCAKLLVESRVPRVVMGSLDPFPLVSGNGLKMLKDANIETSVGVLEKECRELNKEFFFSQERKRPYVYLKWAQTSDGFIDKKRINHFEPAYAVSNDFTSMMVHRLRSQVDAILVGTNTVLLDNPRLTTRLWAGKNPTRIFLDKLLKIPSDYFLYDGSEHTIVITDLKLKDQVDEKNNITYVFLDFTYDSNFWIQLLEKLNELNIQSVLVEGGATIHNELLKSDLWNELLVEVSNDSLIDGILAPQLQKEAYFLDSWRGAKNVRYLNKQF